MKKLLIASLFVFSSVGAQATQHAFLVQNSGWMEPFYQDPSSQLMPLVNSVIQTVSKPSDQVSVSVFNQSNSMAASPEIIYKGAGQHNVLAQLKQQSVARKSSHAYADTDFREAILATIQGPFTQHSGVIWIFTNNKNSPDNDEQTAARNKEFYELLHLDGSITKALAFPLKMPVQGEHFNASGLMVYALAYGDEAKEELDNLVKSGQMLKVFTHQPALLKPLDKDPLLLIPTGVKNSSTIKAGLAADQKTLVFNLEAKNVIPEVKLTADLKNNFYPYNIAATRIEANMVLANGMQAPIEISETDIRLLTTDNIKLEFQLPIPRHLIVSQFSWEALTALGKEITIPATINVTLYEQKLSLSENFKNNLQELFPGDPLSDVFVAPESIKSSTATIPVQFKLKYPEWPMYVALGLFIFLLAAVALLLTLLFRQHRYEVRINGLKTQTIQLKPFKQQSIYSEDYQEVAIVKRGLGQAQLLIKDPNYSVSIRKI